MIRNCVICEKSYDENTGHTVCSPDCAAAGELPLWMLMQRAYVNAGNKGFHMKFSIEELYEQAESENIHSEEVERCVLEYKAMKIALMHSELSEALEALRDDLKDDKLPHMDGVVVELADVCIRIFDFCKEFNLPLPSALVQKMDYNEDRPHKHGKKF